MSSQTANNEQHPLDCAAVLGLVVCALLAVVAPHADILQQPSTEASTCSDVNAQLVQQIPALNATQAFEGAISAPLRRANATLEAALEAAVMGAFVADAASLGLHGYATKSLPVALVMPAGAHHGCLQGVRH